MKLIIDIPKVMYVNAKRDLLFGADILVKAIKNGTPLDDVKAEIEGLRCGQPLRKFVVDECLSIIDNIGKAEREDT